MSDPYLYAIGFSYAWVGLGRSKAISHELAKIAEYLDAIRFSRQSPEGKLAGILRLPVCPPEIEISGS